MVMEFAKGGDMRSLLNSKLELQIEEKLLIITQVCLGIDSIHEAHVIHRDIKPDNILFDSRCTAKIGDFGLSKARSSSQSQVDSFAGTIEYMAPEILKEEKYDSKIDIWSLGVVFYELFTGYRPFEGFAGLLMLNILTKSSKELPSHIP